MTVIVDSNKITLNFCHISLWRINKQITEPTRGIYAPENAYIRISCTIYNPQIKAIPYMINTGYKAPGHLNSTKLGLTEFGKRLQ